MRLQRVPSTIGRKPIRHNLNLIYQEEDQDGQVRLFFEQHPDGNRKQRRPILRHRPQYTKSAHKGRDWIK